MRSLSWTRFRPENMSAKLIEFGDVFGIGGREFLVLVGHA